MKSVLEKCYFAVMHNYIMDLCLPSFEMDVSAVVSGFCICTLKLKCFCVEVMLLKQGGRALC